MPPSGSPSSSVQASPQASPAPSHRAKQPSTTLQLAIPQSVLDAGGEAYVAPAEEGEAAAAASASAFPVAPSAPSGSFVLSVGVVEARHLFSADERDEMEAKIKKRGAATAPVVAKPSSPEAAAASRAALAPPGKAPATSSTKKKRDNAGEGGDDAPYVPLHTFVTFTPFEPVLVPPPPAAAAPPAAAPSASDKLPQTAERKAKGTRAAVDPVDDGPPPPVFLHSIQTPVVTDESPPAPGSGSHPAYQFEHSQRLRSREAFLDRVSQGPFVLTVWQFLPHALDGKRRRGGARGADAGPSSSSLAVASSGAGAAPLAGASARKKKAGAKGADDDDDLPRPFGDLDPEQVVKLGEVHVPLADPLLLQSATRVCGWFPLLMSEETQLTARGLASQRGKTWGSMEMPRAEVYVDIRLDTVLVDAQERAGNNHIRVRVERLERLPSWMVDVGYLQAVEQVKRRAAQAEAAAARAAADPQAPAASSGATDASGTTAATGAKDLSLPLAGLVQPSSARKGGAAKKLGGGGKGAAGAGSDEANPLDDFPEKDYVDSFALKYNLVLGEGVVHTVHTAPPVPAIGMSEQERSEAWGSTMAHEWVVPLRELHPHKGDEAPLTAKEAKAKAAAAAAASKGNSSGRATPSPSDSSTAAASEEVQYAPAVEWNPATPRGALLFSHTRGAYLSAATAQAWKRRIQAGERFLMALEHVRQRKVPTDEKAAAAQAAQIAAAQAVGGADAGKIVQRALAMVDLRGLLKPGTTQLTGAFVVRQLTPPLTSVSLNVDEAIGGKKGAKGTSRAGAGGASTLGTASLAPHSGKRASVSASNSAVEPEHPSGPPPPETFDEARSFIVVTVSLAKPLVPRRGPLSVADVLPATNAKGAPVYEQKVADTFLSRSAGAGIVPVRDLLAAPQRVSSAMDDAPPAPAADDVGVPSSPMHSSRASSLASHRAAVEPASAAAAAAGPMGAFRTEVAALVREWLEEHRVASAKHTASTHLSTSPSDATSLSPHLSESGLAQAALERLKPRLVALIETRFFDPLPTDPASSVIHAAAEQNRAHRRNELYGELAREVKSLIRAHVVSSSGSRISESQAALVRDADVYRAARVRFDLTVSLASHAELAGAIPLAAKHHETRLTSILALYTDGHNRFPRGSAFDDKDLVAAWYEYGAFLIRQQNGLEDVRGLGNSPAADAADTKGARPRGPKTGSIDGGANSALDLGEECMRQCLRYNPSFVPALLNLVLVQLEQDEVEAALDFLSPAIHALPSHPLLLAVQGLYHEMAEEDEQALGAFHRAAEALNEFLAAQHAAGGDGAQGSDALMHVLLGAHGSGAASLPLLHSQSVGLLLARFLASQGFRNLAKRVLDKEVGVVEASLAKGESQGSASASAGDVHQFGPFLELASWYAADRSCFDSYTSPLLQRSQSLLESKPVEAHHPHSLLWALATQGNVLYDSGKFEQAAEQYFMYLNVMQEKDMNIFLDPVVLSRASSLYLVKHIDRQSVELAALLCTHPLHTHSPFHWSLLGQALASSGRHTAAEEAIAEALAKDESCGAAWAARAQVNLARLQAEQDARVKHSQANGAGRPIEECAANAAEFDEAHHAFDRALALGCEARHTWLELGRLWVKSGWPWRAEQAYGRALQLAEGGGDEATIREKLRWLEDVRRGAPESLREKQAATAIQSHLRGVIARKQYQQKKMEKEAGLPKGV